MSEIEGVRYQPVARDIAQFLLGSTSPLPTASGVAGYITEEQQAAKHGVSLATLRRWRRRKYGPPAVQIGRKFFYREDATEHWLEEQESAVKAAAAPPRRGRPRR